MIIATRILKLRRRDGHVDVPVHLYAPRQIDDAWSCRFEIGWPQASQPIDVKGGVDAMQTIETALRLIGAVVYASEEHASGNLMWQGPGRGYGFPVTSEIRDLLIGDDKKLF
jgi:uncharacterized protein DUF6968